MVTTQLAAAEVAERAGAIALQTRQRLVGVVENMSGLLLPDGSTMQIFGEGGGRQVAERLSRAVGADVPLLGQVPLDPALVSAGDSGVPLVLSAPIRRPANCAASPTLSARKRGLAGMSPLILAAETPTPRSTVLARRTALSRRNARLGAKSLSNGVVAGGAGGCAGGAGGCFGLSNLPVKIESSPSSRCLVSAARGVIPRSF